MSSDGNGSGYKVIGDIVRAYLPEDKQRWGEEEWAAHDARCAAEIEARAAEDKTRHRLEAIERLREGGVSARVLETLAGELRYTEALQLAKRIAAGAIGILAGGVGCGKTVAACWWLSKRGGNRPLFRTAAALEATGRYDYLGRAGWLKASALVVDDLGLEHIHESRGFITTMDEIMDHFYNEMRGLIITTNLNRVQFSERYGARLMSRMREVGMWIEIGNEDMRKPKGEGA